MQPTSSALPAQRQRRRRAEASFLGERDGGAFGVVAVGGAAPPCGGPLSPPGGGAGGRLHPGAHGAGRMYCGRLPSPPRQAVSPAVSPESTPRRARPPCGGYDVQPIDGSVTPPPSGPQQGPAAADSPPPHPPFREGWGPPAPAPPAAGSHAAEVTSDAEAEFAWQWSRRQLRAARSPAAPGAACNGEVVGLRLDSVSPRRYDQVSVAELCSDCGSAPRGGRAPSHPPDAASMHGAAPALGSAASAARFPPMTPGIGRQGECCLLEPTAAPKLSAAQFDAARLAELAARRSARPPALVEPPRPLRQPAGLLSPPPAAGGPGRHAGPSRVGAVRQQLAAARRPLPTQQHPPPPQQPDHQPLRLEPPHSRPAPAPPLGGWRSPRSSSRSGPGGGPPTKWRPLATSDARIGMPPSPPAQPQQPQREAERAPALALEYGSSSPPPPPPPPPSQHGPPRRPEGPALRSAPGPCLSPADTVAFASTPGGGAPRADGAQPPWHGTFGADRVDHPLRGAGGAREPACTLLPACQVADGAAEGAGDNPLHRSWDEEDHPDAGRDDGAHPDLAGRLGPRARVHHLLLEMRRDPNMPQATLERLLLDISRADEAERSPPLALPPPRPPQHPEPAAYPSPERAAPAEAATGPDTRPMRRGSLAAAHAAERLVDPGAEEALTVPGAAGSVGGPAQARPQQQPQQQQQSEPRLHARAAGAPMLAAARGGVSDPGL
eukprot:TRINITY_DN22687_c0_g1_i1.p1 TRINITY_DN22687_c0_g1~~TRINITY_DN22687_c0_g1_i1.p1  ORF type:complete len:746 (+),score=145.97 TRINITY_DN22687_c0_g1_i1:76-2238(+)